MLHQGVKLTYTSFDVNEIYFTYCALVLRDSD